MKKRLPVFDDSLDPLLHTLGLDERHADCSRDHYVTEADDEALVALVARGLMEKRKAPGFLAPESCCFGATAAGRVEALAERARRYPPPSRSQARYMAWLDVADCYDLTFGGWLKAKLYDPAVVAENIARAEAWRRDRHLDYIFGDYDSAPC